MSHSDLEFWTSFSLASQYINRAMAALLPELRQILVSFRFMLEDLTWNQSNFTSL
jgi:hypothetical protein